MIKIFDEKIQEYLETAGVSKNEISRIKYRELHKAVVDRIEIVIKLIESEEYDKIEKFLGYSPSGDDMGCENRYIEFGDLIKIPAGMDSDSCDLGEICRILKQLKTNLG